jgi:hypothetical protein
MIFDLIKSIMCIVLGLLAVFFVLGNVSLMNLKTNKLNKTPHGIGSLPAEKQSDDKNLVKELDAHNQNLLQLNGKECQSAKNQIMQNVLVKRQKEQQLDQNKSFLQGLTKQLAPFLDTEPKAPVLENFEDYAPVDIPTNITPKKQQLMQIKKGDNFEPKAANEQDTHYPSKFESEQRASWSGKKGKDDLSYFFDTHAFDKSFDTAQKTPVMCPTQWEKNTKP